MRHYKIISHTDAEKLSAMVQEAIRDGWLPSGGVSVAVSVSASGGMHRIFAQAMTK